MRWQLTMYGPSPHRPRHVKPPYRWERPAVSEFWALPRRCEQRSDRRYWGYWGVAGSCDHWISAGNTDGHGIRGRCGRPDGPGDLTTAYNYAAAAPGGAVLPADIGGETLAPGVYKTTSAQPSLGITGNLTLSGNGVYIFQIVSTLTTAANNSDVILSGGATAQDVFWQVGSSATLGTTTTFAGTIMAQASISLDTGATLNGRALARTGAVTLLSNPVNVPPCPVRYSVVRSA